MTLKEFRKYIDRDSWCYHCGQTEAIAPNHRISRGMGGSKARDVPSNIIVLCSEMNGLIESSHKHAQMAHAFGWKLSSWESSLDLPVWDSMTQTWYRLDNEYSRIALPELDLGL